MRAGATHLGRERLPVPARAAASTQWLHCTDWECTNIRSVTGGVGVFTSEYRLSFKNVPDSRSLERLLTPKLWHPCFVPGSAKAFLLVVFLYETWILWKHASHEMLVPKIFLEYICCIAVSKSLQAARNCCNTGHIAVANKIPASALIVVQHRWPSFPENWAFDALNSKSCLHLSCHWWARVRHIHRSLSAVAHQS